MFEKTIRAKERRERKREGEEMSYPQKRGTVVSAFTTGSHHV
jgi:hypothetical protein